jgi:hypothetical protein
VLFLCTGNYYRSRVAEVLYIPRCPTIEVRQPLHDVRLLPDGYRRGCPHQAVPGQRRQSSCEWAASSGGLAHPGNRIKLKPGVAYCLRAFYELIRDLIEGAWGRFVQKVNAYKLESVTDLGTFLFGGGGSPGRAAGVALQDGPWHWRAAEPAGESHGGRRRLGGPGRANHRQDGGCVYRRVGTGWGAVIGGLFRFRTQAETEVDKPR